MTTRLVYHSLRHTRGRIYLRWGLPDAEYHTGWARTQSHGPHSWRIWLTDPDREWWTQVADGQTTELEDQPYTPGGWAPEYRYLPEGLLLSERYLYPWTELAQAAQSVLQVYAAVPPQTIGVGARGAHWDLGRMPKGGSADLRQVILHNSDRERTPEWLRLAQVLWRPHLLPHRVGHLVCHGVYYGRWRPGPPDLLPETVILHSLWGEVGHLHWNRVPHLLQSATSLSASLWLAPDYPKAFFSVGWELETEYWVIAQRSQRPRRGGGRHTRYLASSWDRLVRRLPQTRRLLLHWETDRPGGWDLPNHQEITIEVGPGVHHLRLTVHPQTERVVLRGYRVEELDLRCSETTPPTIDTSAWIRAKSARSALS